MKVYKLRHKKTKKERRRVFSSEKNIKLSFRYDYDYKYDKKNWEIVEFDCVESRIIEVE